MGYVLQLFISEGIEQKNDIFDRKLNKFVITWSQLKNTVLFVYFSGVDTKMTGLRGPFCATVVLLREITNSNFTDNEEPNKSIFGTT